jgi:DNA-binding NtrC family response regulator
LPDRHLVRLQTDGPMPQSRILILDPNRNDRLLLRHTLNTISRTLHVIEMGDAQSARLACRAQPVDLAFTELTIPRGDGLQLVKTLKIENRQLRLIVVSRDATQSNVLRALRFGADDFIVKPFTTRRVQAVLQRLLDKRTARLVQV